VYSKISTFPLKQGNPSGIFECTRTLMYQFYLAIEVVRLEHTS